MKNNLPVVDHLQFEESLKKLEKVVEALEAGDLPLEESINAYTYGVMLTNHSQKLLDSSEKKIESILAQYNDEE